MGSVVFAHVNQFVCLDDALEGGFKNCGWVSDESYYSPVRRFSRIYV